MQHQARLDTLARVLRLGSSDPRGAVGRLRGKFDKRRDRRAWERLGVAPADFYAVEEDWLPKLHELLGKPWPCEANAEFDAAWSATVDTLRRDARSEEQSTWLEGAFDAVPSFARAAWCLTCHVRPRRVVETGVARGITSRFLLEGLERNGDGLLWSIDLPHPATVLNDQIGVAVPALLRDRWTLILGSSRARLPGLLRTLGSIDLFVHDSLHTTRNVEFELTNAWSKLQSGGAVLVDDIHWNLGFHVFLERTGARSWFAAPRTSERGLWGVAVKP